MKYNFVVPFLLKCYTLEAISIFCYAITQFFSLSCALCARDVNNVQKKYAKSKTKNDICCCVLMKSRLDNIRKTCLNLRALAKPNQAVEKSWFNWVLMYDSKNFKYAGSTKILDKKIFLDIKSKMHCRPSIILFICLSFALTEL